MWLENGDPVYYRHLYVEENEIGFCSTDPFKRFFSVAGFQDLVARAFENCSHQLATGEVVVDDQYLTHWSQGAGRALHPAVSGLQVKSESASHSRLAIH